MPSAESGKNAYIVIGTCTIQSLSSYELESGYKVETYTAVSGGGHEQTVAGVGVGNLTVTGVVDPESIFGSAAPTGTLVTLVIHTSTTAGRDKTATFKCRIGSITLSANRDGTPQTFTAQLVKHGPWTGDLIL